MTTPKEYLEMALGGNMNISTLTLSAWEDLLKAYSKIVLKESAHDELLKFAYNIIDPNTKVPDLTDVLNLIKKAENNDN